MKGWRWFRGGRLDAQLDAELGDHLERQIADYVQAGMAPADARRRARLAFGGVEAIKEQCRDVRRTHWLEQLIQDVRYACRFLRKHPAFTMVAVVSLALGIGANAAIFSLVDAVLLKTLPVREPQELVLLRERQIARENLSWSFAQFQQLGASETLSGLCAFRPRLDFSVAVPDGAELASGQLVSGNCFDVLGVRAWLGRTLTADDDRAADARPVAVISYGFWQRHFAGDPAAIGRPLELKGQMVTIVGVLPAGFNGLEAGRTVDVTLPLALQPTLLKGLGMLASPALTASSNVRWLRLIGRRRTSVPTEQARADLQRRWQQMSPAPQQGRLELIPGAQGLNDLRQQFSLALRLLMAAVGVLLLTACANLASLMLARARAREHEIALRLALGAGRSRIVRQLLTEAAVLSALGGLAGLAIAYWSSHAVVALLSRGRSPIVLDLALDSRLLAFTFGVSVLTTVVFGMWPALWATRADPVGRGLKTPAWHVRTSRSTMLVAAQVALSIVLLVGAGLFVRSLAKLYAFDTGFERSRVLLVGVQPAGSPGGGRRQEELYARMAAIAAVRSATLLMDIPLGGTSVTMGIGAPGRTQDPDEQANFNFVGPRFLETMGIPLIDGRDIQAGDAASARPVAVISESLALRFFRGRRAVGEFIQAGGRLVEIVGVAKGVTYAGVRAAKEMMVYRPYVQEPGFARGGLTLALRTEAAPGLLADDVRRAVHEVAPNLLVSSMTTLDAQFDRSIATERLLATISGFLGATALLLVAIGVYGTLAYAIAQRTRELGVRVALGATGGDIARLVLGKALIPVCAGVGLGLPIALWLSRIAQGILFGITARDPVTYAASTAVLLVVATVAASLPARAAAQADPTTSLGEN